MPGGKDELARLLVPRGRRDTDLKVSRSRAASETDDGSAAMVIFHTIVDIGDP